MIYSPGPPRQRPAPGRRRAGRVLPNLVADPARRIGDPCALLGDLQRHPFGLGKDGRLPPHRDQVEPLLGFPGRGRVLCVYIGTKRAAI